MFFSAELAGDWQVCWGLGSDMGLVVRAWYWMGDSWGVLDGLRGASVDRSIGSGSSGTLEGCLDLCDGLGEGE